MSWELHLGYDEHISGGEAAKGIVRSVATYWMACRPEKRGGGDAVDIQQSKCHADRTAEEARNDPKNPFGESASGVRSCCRV